MSQPAGFCRVATAPATRGASRARNPSTPSWVPEPPVAAVGSSASPFALAAPTGEGPPNGHLLRGDRTGTRKRASPLIPDGSQSHSNRDLLAEIPRARPGAHRIGVRLLSGTKRVREPGHGRARACTGIGRCRAVCAWTGNRRCRFAGLLRERRDSNSRPPACQACSRETTIDDDGRERGRRLTGPGNRSKGPTTADAPVVFRGVRQSGSGS